MNIFQKKAEEFARSKGHTGGVEFLKRWQLSYVFTIKQPTEEDFGEPLVVIVQSNGECQIRTLCEVL